MTIEADCFARTLVYDLKTTESFIHYTVDTTG